MNLPIRRKLLRRSTIARGSVLALLMIVTSLPHQGLLPAAGAFDRSTAIDTDRTQLPHSTIRTANRMAGGPTEGTTAAREITLSTDDNHPPYAYTEHGQPTGIYVRIVERVFAALPQYRLKIVAVPWRRALAMTEAGQAIGVFPPHRFIGQRPYLHKFSEAVLEEVPVVVCNPRSLAAAQLRVGALWPEDFTGLSFGLSNGVKMGGDRFWRLVENGHVKMELASAVGANLKKLAHGRVDCHISDRLTIAHAWHALARAEPELAGQRPTEVAAMPAEHGYLALGQAAALSAAEQDHLLEQFNKELRRLRDNGEIRRIVEAFVSRD